MRNLFENNKKYFFAISYPILIPFALYDSTRWGIQNFYTVFWNSLNMLIYMYAHFKKITKIASSSSFIDRFLFFFYLKEFHVVHCTSTRNFEKKIRKLFMLIYAKLIYAHFSKFTKNASSSLFVDWFWLFFFFW